jgi:Leucine-rich repeat (LRR) protein
MSELCNIDHLALKNFTNLKYLDLSDTYIETVHPQAFKSLTSLETLKILNTSNDGFCWLHYLPTDCFKANKNLKSLYLTIEQISATTLEGLVKLENLKLNLHSKNYFEIWRLDPFKGLKNLKKLTFNWCENDSFNTTYFEDDDDDESYDYDDSEEEEDYRKYLANKRVSIKNSLTHINLNECSFLKWIPNLVELSLTGLNNEFFNKKNCFKHIPKLKVIHIEKTSLKKINSELFSGLKFVTELSLAFNEIKSIDVNAFKDLNKLETLKLNNNKIENLDDNTFVKLTKLQQLDLSGNVINEKTISKNLIQKLRSTVKNFSLVENKIVALKTLSAVSDKVKRINEEFNEGSLIALITNYFNKIIDQIDFVEKRSTKTMKSDEIEKIAKLKIEFIKKVKEIEAYNLNEFKLNSKSIIERINELKQLKLEDNDFEFKQNKELIKLNCWHIYSSDLKLRSIRLKFPLGLLVSINIHVPNEMLYFFR